MPIYKTDNKPFDGPHVLDDPPPFHDAWGRSEYARQWETPADRAVQRKA